MNESRELWVKDDGAICTDYGGNKPRKLAYLLRRVEEDGIRRLVTIGALGSHHVLATGLLGRKLGLSVTAIALPRPYGRHAEQTTKDAILAGVEWVSVFEFAKVLRTLASVCRRDTRWIPPGGSNAIGTLGYIDAVAELDEQIRAGVLPEPDVIFVALGSGGTAAGILAGLARSQLRARLVAVPVLKIPAPRTLVLHLARRALRSLDAEIPQNLASRLEIDSRWIGDGYGVPTQAGETAIQIATTQGLQLESTYTGKAFAAALGWLRWPAARGNVATRTQPPAEVRGGARSQPRAERALFWSTISTTKDSPTENRAVTLSPSLVRLFTSPQDPS
ncbi:MAG: pyridoxal-phosphate dependent enzyme [Anaeromyxobacter sp.]